ncbi:hypothetical protein CP532_3737 [Ophiocordyceps camponoti-leonardi (nom. inval.)]|nr:hypothetical protein CP532_3737 [Ophiocordyceps camponoti-leonardi (nom. inval.)]
MGPFGLLETRDACVLRSIAANGSLVSEIADSSCRCHGEGPCHFSITLFHAPLSVWQFCE